MTLRVFFGKRKFTSKLCQKSKTQSDLLKNIKYSQMQNYKYEENIEKLHIYDKDPHTNYYLGTDNCGLIVNTNIMIISSMPGDKYNIRK